jgi:hypothetical protein
MAAKIVDVIASMKESARDTLLSKHGGFLEIQLEKVDEVLEADRERHQRLLTAHQRFTLITLSLNWTRYCRTQKISEADLNRACPEYLYKRYLKREKQAARVILNGIDVRVLNAVSVNTIIFKFKVEMHLQQLLFDRELNACAIFALKALLLHFDKLSHDGHTIAPGELFAYARRHDLLNLLLAKETRNDQLAVSADRTGRHNTATGAQNAINASNLEDFVDAWVHVDQRDFGVQGAGAHQQFFQPFESIN